jgi:hypothetical protein
MTSKKKKLKCAYCEDEATTGDHVFPSNLYSESKNESKVQRLKVPACKRCNNSWSDDEAHFRDIITLAGKPNTVVNELWETLQRSLDKKDGHKRLKDIIVQMKPVKVGDSNLFKVFPGNDKKVIRVMKKIIRGLCYKHYLKTIPDTQVRTDILKDKVPEKFLEEMKYAHREKDIVEYYYDEIDDTEKHSVWFITFFERTTFIGIVYNKLSE